MYKKVEILDNVISSPSNQEGFARGKQYLGIELFPTYLEYLASQFKYDMLKNIIDDNVNQIFELEIKNDQKNELDKSKNGILAYGEVQSGKTMNMISMLYKAIDLGYNMVFISTGSITKLHEQTVERFKKDEGDFFEFLNDRAKDKYFNFPNREYIFSKIPGSIDSPIRFHDIMDNFTHDDMRKTPKTPYLDVFFILKEQNYYDHVIELSENAARSDDNRKRILFIDDEADWGFEESSSKEKKLYNKIVTIRDNFLAKKYLFKYVAFTATPYNIIDNFNNELITEEYKYLLKAKTYEPDFLADDDFIMQNQPFYCGMDVFHSQNGMKIIDFDTSDLVTRTPTNDDQASEVQLIKSGIILFLINSFYYRKSNAQKIKSAKNYTQGLFFNGVGIEGHKMLRTELRKYLTLLKNKFDNIDALEDKDISFFDFFEINSECIIDIINKKNNAMSEFADKSKIHISNKLLINMIKKWVENNCLNDFKSIVQFSGDEINNDYLDEVEPIDGFKMVVVIGGNKISRGVTFDNLVTEIITAKSEKAGTTLQRARWFGYREINLLKNMNIIMDTEVYNSFIESVEHDKKYRECIKNEM
jgi:hypothetical protein